jgi:hypothetical protein
MEDALVELVFLVRLRLDNLVFKRLRDPWWVLADDVERSKNFVVKGDALGES